MDSSTLRELAIRVSQYFLDFLESDFKRQQAPRRRIALQTDTGFRSGMKVAPYPELQRRLWTLLTEASSGDRHFIVNPRSYTRPMSPILRAIIREQIQAIGEPALATVRSDLLRQAQQTRGAAVKNPEAWVDTMRAQVASELSAQLVRPLLAMLDGPLSEQAYSAVDSLFSAETEIVERVAADLDALLPDTLSRYLATGDATPLATALDTELTLGGVQRSLTAYFDAYVTADAFAELRDLEQYAVTGEGLQLYLYLGALKFGSMTFPIFFVPLDCTRLEVGGGYDLALRQHLYVNKRAIDFVLQELGERQQREWLSPIRERINYLTPEQSYFSVAAPLFREVANALAVAGEVDLTPGVQQAASTTELTLSTALHLAVFDSADEAMLNDYEEMIGQARLNEEGVVELFEGIVRGVIIDNPLSVNEEVDSAWDALPAVDRLVWDSPIPLNEEQIKVLAALQRPDCRFILVEGPPGTGKSHTITAIAADCALKGKSCLVLSDKKEALDVVMAKLTDTMSAVRHDKDFPNPILRLGQQSANFKRLTSNQTLTQVTAYSRASKANEPKVSGALADTRDTLKRQIAQTVQSLGGVALRDVATLYRAEGELDRIAPGLAQALRDADGAGLGEALRALPREGEGLGAYLVYLAETLGACTLSAVEQQGRRDRAAHASARDIGDATAQAAFSLVETLDGTQLRLLQATLLEFDQMRRPVLGYFLRGTRLRQLETQLHAALRTSRPLLLRKDHRALRALSTHAERLRVALPEYALSEAELPAVYRLVARRRTHAIAAAFHVVVRQVCAEPSGALDALSSDGTVEEWPRRWGLAVEYLTSWTTLRAAFEGAPALDYVGSKSQLERLNTTVMNAEVDGRLVNFMNNHRADAKVLGTLISQRQKFPADKFGKVKEAFPIIVASIREFGEYMPLKAGLFDVLIIDEASQVSVAQAFPALLRAKKIVVLGDSKQFSNTKSSNASNALNSKYRADLEQYFRREVSREAGALTRLARFDVKKSVLEFVELCANYQVMLRKHFRSYAELISFSSKTFYAGQLQAIKIRGCPLEDVIQFSLVDATGHKVTRGTNPAEAQFILERLLELIDEEEPPTVGVITPFREQQTLLTKTLFGHVRGAEFQDRLRLKVMTCDSCQGEERHLIFYSLVATDEHDALNYVFPVHLDDAGEAVEDKLKIQRLNVAFSRAQEMIWFVHSKPIDHFHGAIAKVLHHYQHVLDEGLDGANITDPASPMEAQLLGWLKQTPFYQQAGSALEVLPQFPLGRYLQQLDPTYSHPAYRVDFLLTFSALKERVYVVIEYDGFAHHFQTHADVHIGNHERYLVEADVERQLVLESYGYRFLRVNRFNLGTDPVQTLSDRLTRLVTRALELPDIASVDALQAQAAGLVAKELKPCSRCGEIQSQEAFFDQALKGGAGGFGRLCALCKAKDKASARVSLGHGHSRFARRRWRR